MTTVCKSVIIPYSAQKMFNIVADIHRYPEFLPWCVKGEVLWQGDSTDHLKSLMGADLSTFPPLNIHMKDDPRSREPYYRVARVHIGYGALKTQFTTVNHCATPWRLTLSRAKGMEDSTEPFSHLQGYWLIEPLDGYKHRQSAPHQNTHEDEEVLGSKVSVVMDYEFKNIILKKLMGGLFARIIEGFTTSFVARAHDLYGKK